MIINKTWNDFWGEFLLVTFHKDNPERLKHVEKKAEWVLNNGHILPGMEVLDLACGSGMIDIHLAKKGIHVTAIDRIERVLEIARKEAGKLPVKFIHGDIREASFPNETFDCILIFETLGLMSKTEDQTLIKNSYRWLKKNGKLIIDCPEPSKAGPNFWEKTFPEGILKFETEFDPISGIQTISPELICGDDTIQIYDAYSTDKGDHSGVKRYLYKKDEIIIIMNWAGFEVTEVPHYWGEKYYAVKGIKI